MNELLPIKYEDEEMRVSARELHKALGIEKRFSSWFLFFYFCENQI